MGRRVAAAIAVAFSLWGPVPGAQPLPSMTDASVDADAAVAPPEPATAVPDSTPAPTADEADEAERPLTPEEERAAARLFPDEREPPDPIADEAERTGPFEGPATPDQAALATEIVALSDRACFRALTRAGVRFERVRQPVAGVITPVVVTGPLRGVTVRNHSAPVIHELMDCRLAVALARYAPMLRGLGVREIRHISLYRAPTASQAARRPVQTRHPGGMAIDVGSFVMESGATLVVERDFHGRRRRPVCGPTARVPDQPQARTLRTLACEAARRGYFHVVLTPNFNAEHRNHFHLEVARNVSWLFVR